MNGARKKYEEVYIEWERLEKTNSIKKEERKTNEKDFYLSSNEFWVKRQTGSNHAVAHLAAAAAEIMRLLQQLPTRRVEKNWAVNFFEWPVFGVSTATSSNDRMGPKFGETDRVKEGQELEPIRWTWMNYFTSDLE